MAYIKKTWVDQSVERPKTYEMTNNADGSVTLIDSFGLVSELGTPVNEDNMNHIEDGIAATDARKYSTTEVYEKYEWVTAIIDDTKKLYQSLKENNQGHAVTEEEWWQEVSFGSTSSGTSLPLFTPVIQDRILSYEESQGYALQGTYVYKTAIAGSRYGYPDFYNKCIEEYNNSTPSYIAGSAITQPVFTANTTNGITVSDSRSNTTLLQSIMNGTAETNVIGDWKTYWVNINYNTPTALKSYVIRADNNHNAEYPQAWTVQASNDGVNYDILDTVSGQTFSVNQSKTYQISQNVPYKQYKIVFSAGIEASAGGELKKLTFNAVKAIPVKRNSNGHIFYDIEQKPEVDALYNDTGIADMYGVDEENERIFLPRNKWFMQLCVDTGEVNKFNKAGLPNITGIYPQNALDVNNGCFYISDVTNGYSSSPRAQSIKQLGFDASRSSSIYGNSNTVQPPSSNKLLYYVVGNTVQESAITDVTEITTSENDTFPLGYSLYQTSGQASAAWLKSYGQWNSGNVYTTFYQWLVNQLGTNTLVKQVTDENITDYDFVVNQNDMTFRLPLKNGDEFIPDFANKVSKPQGSSSNPNIASENCYVCYRGASIQGNGLGAILFVNNLEVDGAHGSGLDSLTKSGIVFVPKGTSYYMDTARFDYCYEIPLKGNGGLYFKVSNAVQNLELLDAGEVLNALIGKLDKSAVKAYIVETYQNGASGYRIYSDGFCEQWGTITTNGGQYTSVNLLKSYSTNKYNLVLVDYVEGNTNAYASSVQYQYNGRFTVYRNSGNTGLKINWNACGYIS